MKLGYYQYIIYDTEYQSNLLYDENEIFHISDLFETEAACMLAADSHCKALNDTDNTVGRYIAKTKYRCIVG